MKVKKLEDEVGLIWTLENTWGIKYQSVAVMRSSMTVDLSITRYSIQLQLYKTTVYSVIIILQLYYANDDFSFFEL